MKKPVNKFAVALWVLAAVVFAGLAAQIVMAISTMRAIETHGDTLYVVFHGTGLVIALLTPVQFIALGVIIEMIDQIRWNTRQK